MSVCQIKGPEPDRLANRLEFEIDVCWQRTPQSIDERLSGPPVLHRDFSS